MLEKLESYFAGNWKILFIIVFFPVTWVPWLFTDGLVLSTLKICFLGLPILLIIVSFWCTILSFLTIFFRPNRVTFTAIILITWWDGGKAIITYWAGFFKFLILLFGWLWGSLRIVIVGTYYSIREILFFPLTLMKGSAKNYFQPGIPWVAVTITLFWIVLESLIFSSVIATSVTETMSNLLSSEPNENVVSILLFLFLTVIIGGSFACMHALMEAIDKKHVGTIIKMSIVEVVVAALEIIMFYREFVESLAPMLAQMGNFQMGPGTIISIASLAWLGVRACTWFLFGKYGTPTLLNLISREGILEDGKAQNSSTTIGTPLEWIKHIVGNLQKEINWFSAKGNELVEAFILPPVQILAVMTNFAMVLLTSKNLFDLPIKSISDLKSTKELIDELAKKGAEK